MEQVPRYTVLGFIDHVYVCVLGSRRKYGDEFCNGLRKMCCCIFGHPPVHDLEHGGQRNGAFKMLVNLVPEGLCAFQVF